MLRTEAGSAPPARRLRSWPRVLLRVAATLVLGCVAWACLAWLSGGPLGRIYGWSGHPPIPKAPTSVYVGLFLVVLPVVSFAGAWLLTGGIASLARR